MSWLGLWLYLVAGEFVLLTALSDEEGVAQVRWLFSRARWWMPYVGASLFVVAWPPAAVALLLMPHKGKPTNSSD